jgi:Protein of unknown function (DUF742)
MQRPTGRDLRGAELTDDGGCPECLETDATCPRCVQRGAYALRLLRHGRSVAEAAARLRLPPNRVRVLLGLAHDRREVRSYGGQRPLAADAQAIIAQQLERDPELTRAEIARRLRPPMRLADFDRAFGYTAAKPGGRPPQFVTVEMGSRLMIALGRAPRELDGC